MAAKKSSTSQVIALVLAVAFGVIALALTYSAAIRSTEQRSRAAEAELAIKQWEFNGTTTEGWTLTNFSSVRIAGGLLRTVYGKPVQSASLQNTNVGAILPEGAKYLKFQLGLRQPGGERKSPGPTKQQASNIAGTVEYTLANKKTVAKALAFRVMTDGTLRDFSITLPEIAAATVGSLKISFIGLKPGSQLEVDWIRLIGTKPQPTPTPTITCNAGVKTISFQKLCTPDGQSAYYAQYVCLDGYSGLVGDGKTCQSVNDLRLQVERICQARSNCPVPSKEPMPITTTTCGPVACKVPPAGCYYQGGTSCSCGILVCSVQVVTPTPTPSFKPL